MQSTNNTLIIQPYPSTAGLAGKLAEIMLLIKKAALPANYLCGQRNLLNIQVTTQKHYKVSIVYRQIRLTNKISLLLKERT